MKINTSKGKTEVVLVNVAGEIKSLVTPAVVTCVEKYTYLGTDPFDTEGQFHQRKGKAWGAIKKLDTFWSSKSVGFGVKRQLFQSIVESVFTYGAVCWPTTVHWRDKIDRAYTSMLRYCLKTGEEEYDLYSQGGLAHLSSRIADGRPRDEARAIVGSGADEHVPAATGGAEADRREADREGCWRGGQEILAGDGCGSRRVEAARAGDRQRQRGEDLSEALERKTTEMV